MTNEGYCSVGGYFDDIDSAKITEFASSDKKWGDQCMKEIKKRFSDLGIKIKN